MPLQNLNPQFWIGKYAIPTNGEEIVWLEAYTYNSYY